MLKTTTVGLLVSILAFVVASGTIGQPAKALAKSDEELIDSMKSKLEKELGNGEMDEGEDDLRDRTKSGTLRKWNTYPGKIYIEPERGEAWRGKLIVHFSGRERDAKYVAGVQKSTSDTQASGRVVAEYEFTRGDKVLITKVKKEGGRGRVGNTVATKVEKFSGTQL